MTIAVDLGRKATKTNKNSSINRSLYGAISLINYGMN